MARYIDADELLKELQEELDFETPMYTEEQNKYFNSGLRCAIRDVKKAPTADVVPKSEVNKWVRECEELQGWLIELEKEVVTEIFEEIDNKLHDMAVEYHNAGHPEYFAVCEVVHHKVIRQVEKKYTEGEKEK